MLVNKETFNLKSTVTDDWGGSHRLVLNLEALATAKDWELGISFPDDYVIDQIYGGEVVQREGKNYISGKSWNGTLEQGENTEIILIVHEGNSSNSDPIQPEFIFADSTNSDSTSPQLKTNSQIVEDWAGGYKVELEISAESQADDWTLDFELPYNIAETYGVDIVNNRDGSYTIDGQNDQVNLSAGQTVKAIFIIEDN